MPRLLPSNFACFKGRKRNYCWPFCRSTCHISNVNVWTELSLIVKSQWFAAQKGKNVFRVKICYYGESENSEKSENARLLLQILYQSTVEDLWPINFVQVTISLWLRETGKKNMRLLTWRLLPIASHYSGALVFGLTEENVLARVNASKVRTIIFYIWQLFETLVLYLWNEL